MSERPVPPAQTAPRARAGMSALPAPWVLAIDTVAVLVFTAVGRASHAETSPVLGVLATAWPFLAALAAGWCVVLLRSRAAPRTVAGAIPMWFSTVTVGMLLRVAAGRGVAVSFVVVATVVLGAFLLGWRALAALVGRRQARP